MKSIDSKPKKVLEQECKRPREKRKVGMYARVGNIEQLEYYVDAKINNKLQSKIAGLYIRVGTDNDAGMRYSIDQQRSMLDDYCKRNNIENRVEYIDIGKSGLDKTRKALLQMVQDIKDNNIDVIITKDFSRLFRNIIEAKKFLEEPFMKGIEVILLDDSIQRLKDITGIIKGASDEKTIDKTTQITDDLSI